jgi:hypothetical protein
VGRTAADTGDGAERGRHPEQVVTDPIVGRDVRTMERTDWLDKGFDASDARFLMVTAISHHRFRSPIWGEEEIRKLSAELVEIDRAAEHAVTDQHTRQDERTFRGPRSWSRR